MERADVKQATVGRKNQPFKIWKAEGGVPTTLNKPLENVSNLVESKGEDKTEKRRIIIGKKKEIDETKDESPKIEESDDLKKIREEVERLEMKVRDVGTILSGQKTINIGIAKKLEKFILNDGKLKRGLCGIIHDNENMVEEINQKKVTIEQNKRKLDLKRKELETLRKINSFRTLK